MADRRLYRILIYHDGVEGVARVRGRKFYLEEIAFLNALTGAPAHKKGAAEPGSDGIRDYYMLDLAQLKAYDAFRREASKARRQQEAAPRRSGAPPA
jgi:hypothetical protein